MRKLGGKWMIHLCRAPPKGAAMLETTGIPGDDAQALAARPAAAEKVMPTETLARFSTFEGFVRMDVEGQYPPTANHQHKH